MRVVEAVAKNDKITVRAGTPQSVAESSNQGFIDSILSLKVFLFRWINDDRFRSGSVGSASASDMIFGIPSPVDGTVKFEDSIYYSALFIKDIGIEPSSLGTSKTINIRKPKLIKTCFQ